MAQVLVGSPQPLSAEARAQYQASPCEICVGQSGTGTEFPPSTSVYTVSIIPQMHNTHIHLRGALPRRTNG